MAKIPWFGIFFEESSELTKYEEVIADLRAAAHAAVESRRTELQHNGRLLQTLRLTAGATELQFSLEQKFLKHVSSATELDLLEPYLVSEWKRYNLHGLLAALVRRSHVRCLRLVTH